MKASRTFLKFTACLFGGIVLASFVFLAIAMIVFGRRGDGLVAVFERWIPFVWIVGATFGGWVARRSIRRTKA
jgi:hypothetical protein